MTRRRLPWLMLGVTIALLCAMVPLSVGGEETSDTVIYGLLALSLATAGAFIASRQPGNPIGWIFCVMGVYGGALETWEAFPYHSLPTGAAGEWVISWSWVVDLTVYALIFLLFPTGRLLTPHWRRVVWLLIAGCLIAIPGQALSSDNTADFGAGGNLLAVDSPIVDVAFGVGISMVLLGLVAAVVSIVMRYRRATGVERLQLKQFVLAGGVIVVVMVTAVPFYYDSELVRALAGLGFVALPAAVALAILRYRLYDIDVLIRRTLVYGGLSATLAATYVAGVLLLQLALGPLTEQSDLAIAGSTLAVAAVVRPARARIQAFVDRRFYRRKYDAARTVEGFGARLRDEVELESLSAELRRVASDTMQPAHVSLWLRGTPR
jgi:hypothetical protein